MYNSFDIDYQNETLRKLKKKFWWYVLDPDSKTYGYITWHDDVVLKPIERACWLAYHHYYGWIMKTYIITTSLTIEEYMPYFSQSSVDENIANLIIPSFVSIFEDFMKTFFTRYLTYDVSHMNKERKIDKKLSFEEIEKIQKWEISISHIIADSINFQNLEGLNKAYRDYIWIELHKKMNINIKCKSWNQLNLYSELDKIIKKRHRIIHKAEFIYINKKELLDYIDVFDKIWNVFIDYFFTQRGFRFDLNKF